MVSSMASMNRDQDILFVGDSMHILVYDGGKRQEEEERTLRSQTLLFEGLCSFRMNSIVP